MGDTLNIKVCNLIINLCTLTGLIFCILFIIYGIQSHIFTSSEALNSFLMKFGLAAPVAFVAIQALQVVVPILPGSIGCLGGVLIFGVFNGFIYNYIGICVGSLLAFLVSRKYGIFFARIVTGEKIYNKYIGWLNKSYFDRLFAAAIFLPFAPDDFLCYLAGLTKMPLYKFIIIILAGKPLAIFLYSMGLEYILQFVINFFN